MDTRSDRAPRGRHQSRKAAASGWIGSAPQHYDFFIYATAASLDDATLALTRRHGLLYDRAGAADAPVRAAAQARQRGVSDDRL
jgi:hypothetical protein